MQHEAILPEEEGSGASVQTGVTQRVWGSVEASNLAEVHFDVSFTSESSSTETRPQGQNAV